MKSQADKTGTEKSKAVANTASAAGHEAAEAEVLFEDKRPEAVARRQLADKADHGPQAVAQRQLVDNADHGPQAGKIAQLQVMANAASAEPVQLHESEGGDELLEDEPAPAQRIGKEEAMQSKGATVQKKDEKPANNTGLPDTLKSGIEGLSGLSMDDVKVHYNSAKPAQLQAHAFAQGTDIHMAPGQEQHLPHEAWHVVQQKQGRVKPTMQMKGRVDVNDDAGLEKEADVMGARANDIQKKEVKAQQINKIIIDRRVIQKVGEYRPTPLGRSKRGDFYSEGGEQSENQEKYIVEVCLPQISEYLSSINELVEELNKKEVSAASWNKRLGQFSAAQIAFGGVASVLGIAIVVFTSGVAVAPAVVAGLSSGATSSAIAASAAGAAGSASKGGRNQAMGYKNKAVRGGGVKKGAEALFDHATNPDNPKKAGAEEGAKAGAVQSILFGLEAGGATAPATAEGAVQTSVQAVAGASVGLAGGVVNVGLGYINRKDAKKFSTAELYKGEQWDLIAGNLHMFKNHLQQGADGDRNPDGCKNMIRDLKETKKIVESFHGKTQDDEEKEEPRGAEDYDDVEGFDEESPPPYEEVEKNSGDLDEESHSQDKPPPYDADEIV